MTDAATRRAAAAERQRERRRRKRDGEVFVPGFGIGVAETDMLVQRGYLAGWDAEDGAAVRFAILRLLANLAAEPEADD